MAGYCTKIRSKPFPRCFLHVLVRNTLRPTSESCLYQVRCPSERPLTSEITFQKSVIIISFWICSPRMRFFLGTFLIQIYVYSLKNPSRGRLRLTQESSGMFRTLCIHFGTALALQCLLANLSPAEFEILISYHGSMYPHKQQHKY